MNTRFSFLPFCVVALFVLGAAGIYPSPGQSPTALTVWAESDGALLGQIRHNIAQAILGTSPAAATPTASSTPAVCYDVNHSGQVDLDDIQLVASDWHKASSPYNLDGDGMVTVVDVAMVAAQWGWDCGMPAPIVTPTATHTSGVSQTATPTPTSTSTRTPTPTPTPTIGASPTATLTPSPTATGSSGPTIGGCPVFPANNVWNARIDHLPVDPNSQAYVNNIGASAGLHPDFGSGLWNGGPIGIPFVTVPGTQPLVPIDFIWYGDESDPGPYPIPTNAPIEGGSSNDGDRHVLVVETGTCKLYELYYAWPQADGSWQAGSGAVYDLRANALRPAGWTSADAAGLPILPGLVRYDEIASGAINHALRFTVPRTRREYIWPARHYASSSTDPTRPPMGQRFRLKASFDISGFSPTNRVILTALKTYGMIVADNGSSWYLSGVPDERWDNDDLHNLQSRVHGSDFEAVDESSLMLDPNSSQVR